MSQYVVDSVTENDRHKLPTKTEKRNIKTIIIDNVPVHL